MDLFYNITLAVLEMSFLLVLLLLMHGLKNKIGIQTVYLSLGLLFSFTQLLGTFGLSIETGYVGMDVHLTSGVLLLPFLSTLIVIYIADGTFAAQRVIIGMMVCFGIFLYLSFLTSAQLGSIMQSRSNDVYLPAISYMIRNATKQMAANVISFSFDIFFLPFAYQWLRNLRINSFLCVTATLFVIAQVDAIIFSGVVHWGEELWWSDIQATYVFNALLSIWFGVILTFYLRQIHAYRNESQRNTYDIFLAFFGNYGKRVELEKSLQASEERYEILFRNAIANILVVSKEGIIREVNESTPKTFRLKENEIIGQSFPALTAIPARQWTDLVEKKISHFTSHIPALNITLEMNMNDISIHGAPMLLIHCRDISENLRREQERIAWQEQASHRERLASIGELAGGIAHDFNNFLQTIQGHLDNIIYFYPVEDENARHQLECIDAATQKAAMLTKQLLGFARRGKYNVVKIELGEFVDDVAGMFRPIAADCNFSVIKPKGYDAAEEGIHVMGDNLQLQQVLMNILMNARDALKGTDTRRKVISITFDYANKTNVEPNPPADAEYSTETEYAAICIRDTGSGIPEEIRKKIFEPFFTTKPVGQGTGMGLSMAYGILLSHKGWIQTDTPEDGEGTIFSLFLPVAKKS